MSITRFMSFRAWSVAALGIAALALGACPDTDDGPNAVCGNGVQEVGESCDDGNLWDGDGCSSSCQREGFCRNGRLEPGEECDDGNYQDGDGCNADCGAETGCGNGILDVGEQCDDDNRVSGDGCSATCLDEEPGAVCGNGIWEIGEGCDDGNTQDEDDCSSTCQREDGCGDGVLDSGEQCDDGNNVSGDGCHYDCRSEFFCGDGVCDEANAESCEYCPRDCCPNCGNGRLDLDEGCDDGNNVSGDGCSAGCVDEVPGAECGNGIWEVGEGCDDGNTSNADGCDSSCQPEFVCGDSICDVEHYESCVLCPQDCCPECGDGNVDPGEQCDGSQYAGLTCEDFCYTGGSLSCTSTCQIDTSSCTGDLPTCGDNQAGCDEECDGSDKRSQTCATLGFTGGSLGCSQSCTFDVSGCTGRLWYLNEGFEGTELAFGWRAGGIWEVGAPTTVGPSAAYAGTNCAGTRISANYDSNASWAIDTLESPRVDLTSATNPRLRFYRWFDTQAYYDGGNLWISLDGGVSFSLLSGALLDPGYDHDPVHAQPAWTGRFGSHGWVPVVVNLGSYVGRQVVLRWAFASDGTDNDYPGFYVDNVLIVEAANLPVEISNSNPLQSAVVNYAYQNELRATGGSGVYNWSIEGGTNHEWLSINPSTGLLSGTPDASDVGDVTVVVRVEESTNATNFDERTFDLDVLSALYYENLESNPASWEFPMGFPPLIPAAWDWGNATSGPMSCHSGTGCVATSVGGNYDASMAMMGAAVSTGIIDLAGAAAPVLTYWQWIKFATADGGYVLITDENGDNQVTPIPAYNGTTPGSMYLPGSPGWIGDLSSLGWHQVTIDLSPWAGQLIQISWNLEGTAAGTHPGWYIDDILIAD
ncbi:MAG: DUF4215 domain-containing protein [Polyangia bacterium]|jgi:cysteine-rich repeat protein|nr:DUF4215 domain-containing protein [Polyangia bacterium]